MPRDQRTGSGIGTPGARWAMLGVWVLAVVSTGQAGVLATPYGAGALGLSLVVTLWVTTPGDATVRPDRAWAAAVLTVASAALVLSVAGVGGEVFAVTHCSYVMALLAARGNWIEGATGGALVLAAIGVTGVVGGASVDAVVATSLTPLTSYVAGLLWATQLHRIVAAARTIADETARAEAALEAAIAASRRAEAELDEIGRDAVPLLRAVVRGDELTPDLVDRLTITEAEIRDRLRSPRFQHPALVRSVRELRGRGVHVALMGEPDPASTPFDASLIDAVVALIDPVERGRVTIREIPAGRAGAVSVLIADGDRSAQTVLDEVGRVVPDRLRTSTPTARTPRPRA